MTAIALLLWNQFKSYIIMGGTVLALVGTIYFKGRKDAKAAYTERRNREKARARATAEKIRARNRKIPDSDLDHELAEWMRDESDI